MAILIDDANWGCLLRGVLIGIYREETKEMEVGEIPVEYFQLPKFRRKDYLQAATDVAAGLLIKLNVKKNEPIKVCTGYVLRGIRRMLDANGYNWRQGKIVGEFQEALEQRARKYVQELGVDLESTSADYANSFFICLNWLKDSDTDASVLPEREIHAKTGWRKYEIWAHNPLPMAKALAHQLSEEGKTIKYHRKKSSELHRVKGGSLKGRCPFKN